MIGQIAALFPWPAPMWNADAEALPLQDDLVRDVRRPLLRAAGRGRDRAADRVRERREPAALARGVAAQGDRAAGGARREPRPHPAPAADRERGALARWAGLSAWRSPSSRCAGLKPCFPPTRAASRRSRIDGGVLAFVTGLSVLSGLWFGLAPAASASRVDLAVGDEGGRPARDDARPARGCAARSSPPRWRSPWCWPSGRAS